MLPQIPETSHEVLIVEDNPSDARLLEILLDEADIEPLHVTRASRLDEARERLEAKPVDAIFLDLGLPDAQGLECLSALTKSGAPIVVVSGNRDERLRDQATQFGVVDYLLKDDLGVERLGRSLRVALRQSALQSEIASAHRRCKQAESDLAELVVQLDIPIVVSSPQGQIWYANRAAGDLLGVEPAMLQGLDLDIGLDDEPIRTTRITDFLEREHLLHVHAQDMHWCGKRATLVLIDPIRSTGVVRAEDDATSTTQKLASIEAAASQINALGLHVGEWIGCIDEQQGKLHDLLTRLQDVRERGAENDDVFNGAVSVARDARRTLDDIRNPMSRLMQTSVALKRAATHTRHLQTKAIDGIVEDACRRVAARVDPRVEISKRLNAHDATVADPLAAYEAVEQLVRGLAEVSSYDAGTDAVELTVRTARATDRVVVSVDAVVGSCTKSLRREAMRHIMGNGREGDPRHALAGTLVAVREAGGTLRCGCGDDDRLWIEISLPRCRS